MTKQQLSTMLEDWYIKKSSQIILMPGKPGVGKTEFLKNWISDKSGIYLRCELQHDRIQIPRFAKALQLYQADIKFDYENWEDFFETLFQIQSKNPKTVIVMDEFPKLIKSNRSILSMIEQIWSKTNSKRPLMLILCGSSMPDMNYSYLRLTNLAKAHPSIIRIPFQPLSFAEFAQEHKELKIEDTVALYGITGGVERFVSKIQPKLGLKDNLLFFLDHRHYLFLNPIYLFNYDFHDPTTYFSILQILASNEKKIGYIAKRLQLKTHNLTSFLDRLRELEIIERLLPPTDEVPEASRKGRYHIVDPFYRFWFRYVYPFQDILSIDRSDVVLELFMENYKKFMKETLGEILSEKLKTQPLFPVRTVGPWWDKNKYIDLIALGDKDILFAALYYSDQVVGLEELDELVRSTEMVSVPRRIKNDHFLLFSKSGFKDDLNKEVRRKRRIHLWTMENLLP